MLENDSRVNTVEVPNIGSDPATLTVAASVPMRVVVRNIGGSDVLIAYDSPSLKSKAPSANTFKVPAGEEDIFVLNIKQGLYAASLGGPGRICIAVSDAFPTYRMES